MIRNIRLKSHAVERLVLKLQLGHLCGELHSRIVQRAAALGLDVQDPGNLEVSCAKYLKLVEADARGLHLALIRLPLREVRQISLRIARGHTHGTLRTNVVA